MGMPFESEHAAAPVQTVLPSEQEPVMRSVAFFGRPVAVPLGWLVVLLLLLLEWALFVQFANRELLGAYPTGYDQSVYLSQAYETYDHIIKDGLWGGLRHGLLMKLPQGKMMHLQAALLLLIGGPNRLTALSINFFYFALLQCLVVYTLLWLTRRWSAAFLGLGLLLTTRSRFLLAGGVADFRLDNIAFCLFGVFVCLAVRSGVFASKRWSLAAGLAGGLLILFRFQTALTLAASLAVLLALLCLLAWRGRESELRAAALERVRGLLYGGLLIAGVIVPAIWLAREELRAYYIGQAVTGPKIRAAELGATGAFSYWAFYARSLIFDHLGGICCLLALVILVVLFFAARLRPAHSAGEVDENSGFPFILLFLAVMFFMPLLILTVYPVRNPIVGNILITPALGLIMTVVVAFAGRSNTRRVPAVSDTLVALAALVFACGVATELAMAPRGTYLSGEKESVRNVLQLYDEIALRSRKMGWATPRLTIDRLQDYLFPAHEAALSYERSGILVRPQSLLGNEIQEAAPAFALDAVKNSDFAVITDVSSPEGPGFAFPFNVSMKRIQPKLQEAADRYLVPVKRFQVFAHHFTLYMRPSVQMLGDSGGWITSRGLTLVAPAETLRARPNIELAGTTILAEYLGKTTMKAELVTGDGGPVAVPVKFDLPVVPKSVVQYKAVICLGTIPQAADGDVQVKLSFDKFFIPKQIGFNEDPRQLVVMTPKQVTLLP